MWWCGGIGVFGLLGVILRRLFNRGCLYRFCICWVYRRRIYAILSDFSYGSSNRCFIIIRI